jgi:DNA polymerase/3'-5' exonuclease PolX
MSDEPKRFSLEEARQVARVLAALLSDDVERIQIVGSIRRKRPVVSDIELLYIPKMAVKKGVDLFGDGWENQVDTKLEKLLAWGFLEKRLNAKGHEAWGEKNKLARHVRTGIPVDLFSATADNWWNYLVCRTGGMESNIQICQAAREKGWKWEPYGAGFSKVLSGSVERVHVCRTEQDVFEFAGLTYKEPHLR